MKKLVFLFVVVMFSFMCTKPQVEEPIKPNWLAYVGYGQVQNTPFYAYLEVDSINNNQFFILVAKDSIPDKWNLLVGQPNNIVRISVIRTEQDLQQWHKILTGQELKLPE